MPDDLEFTLGWDGGEVAITIHTEPTDTGSVVTATGVPGDMGISDVEGNAWNRDPSTGLWTCVLAEGRAASAIIIVSL